VNIIKRLLVTVAFVALVFTTPAKAQRTPMAGSWIPPAIGAESQSLWQRNSGFAAHFQVLHRTMATESGVGEGHPVSPAALATETVANEYMQGLPERVRQTVGMFYGMLAPAAGQQPGARV
jgi:hypothetical protein